MDEPEIQQLDDAVIFTVKVVPGSSKTQTAGLLNGMIKIRISAAPEKGKANKALIDFIAEQLDVKSTAVSIISGLRTAVKRVQVTGIRADKIAKVFT